jgi:predicted ester cyclase
MPLLAISGKNAMTVLQTAVETFLDQVWVRGDTSCIAEMVRDDVMVFGLEDTPLDGLSDYLSFHRMVRAQFKDISLNIRQTVENGDWIALMAQFCATDVQTGRAGRTCLQMMTCVQDGKIAQCHVLIDYISLFEQIGRLPERTLDLCLLDHRLEAVQRRA